MQEIQIELSIQTSYTYVKAFIILFVHLSHLAEANVSCYEAHHSAGIRAKPQFTATHETCLFWQNKKLLINFCQKFGDDSNEALWLTLIDSATSSLKDWSLNLGPGHLKIMFLLTFYCSIVDDDQGVAVPVLQQPERVWRRIRLPCNKLGPIL